MADILIRGMEMPIDCHSCWMRVYCFERGIGIWGCGKGKPCPLVPLPEGHGRLGDLDKLDYAFTALRFNEDGSLNHWGDRKNWCLHGNEIETILANAPTIVPAEGGGNDGN